MGADWQMPGRFYCLGSHLSQHSGANAEVETFKPTFCACTDNDCDVAGKHRMAVETIRKAAKEYVLPGCLSVPACGDVCSSVSFCVRAADVTTLDVWRAHVFACA